MPTSDSMPTQPTSWADAILCLLLFATVFLFESNRTSIFLVHLYSTPASSYSRRGRTPPPPRFLQSMVDAALLSSGATTSIRAVGRHSVRVKHLVLLCTSRIVSPTSPALPATRGDELSTWTWRRTMPERPYRRYARFVRRCCPRRQQWRCSTGSR